MVGDKVEAAYRRGDLLEKRRRLMDGWAAHCQVAENASHIKMICMLLAAQTNANGLLCTDTSMSTR